MVPVERIESPEAVRDSVEVITISIDVVSGDAHPVSWSDIGLDVVDASGASGVHWVTADADGRVVIPVGASAGPLAYSLWVDGDIRASGWAHTDQRVVVEL